MDSIGIEATSRSSGDVHPLSLPTVLGMLCLVILLGIISSRALRARGLAVNNLFLKINFKRDDREQTGFVRSLDVNKMNLVMTEAPARGESLTINLSSLPGFPDQGKVVKGIVNKAKPISGNNQNYLVEVTLDPQKKGKYVEESLVNYLRHLHA